jgi:fatty-acyl-CoA synthase
LSLINHEQLSPGSFLGRAVAVFADRAAVVDGDVSLTYRELAGRVYALTGVLESYNVQPGDRVATLCSNSHVMVELHHAAPLRGAVLVTLNTRLADVELIGILEHAGARVLVATREHVETAARIAAATGVTMLQADVPDSEYERLLRAAVPAPIPVTDERALLALNYTSGTTGRPKGVMYHHRGAWLQTVAMCYHADLRPGSQYLWTLPMFHCNGWSFPWAVTAAGATQVCLRTIDTAAIWRHLRAGVTHFSAAPTVLTMIAEDQTAAPLDRPVQVTTGGAPPTPALLSRLARLGIQVTHLYGLTETFGPSVVNQWQPEWDDLPADERAGLLARQGIPNITGGPVRVVDEQGAVVVADGEHIGELTLRGNTVMLGYYHDEDASEASENEGWFRTGDLAVVHPDGYVEIRDRLKDVIISGGENIASTEVERVLDSHPDVVESAVVGREDARWGEVPVAYVSLRPGASVAAPELVSYAREHLAGYKVPKDVIFGPLPKTSTGKINKNTLRAALREDEHVGTA